MVRKVRSQDAMQVRLAQHENMVQTTAVQDAEESGRRSLDFVGYWTSRGADPDEVPDSCCPD
jgi:hypothetical protein